MNDKEITEEDGRPGSRVWLSYVALLRFLILLIQFSPIPLFSFLFFLTNMVFSPGGLDTVLKLIYRTSRKITGLRILYRS